MRGDGGVARAADRSCGVPRVVDPAAPIVPRTMRGAPTTWRRKRAACKGTRRLVRAIFRAVVHTLNPLENQRFLHSVTIVRDLSDNCQVLWNACPALSRNVNAYLFRDRLRHKTEPTPSVMYRRDRIHSRGEAG